MRGGRTAGSSLILVAALLAALLPRPAAGATVLEVLAADGRFGRFLELAQRAGMEERLRQPGPLTIFAPTDAAFAEVLAARARAPGRAEAAPWPDAEALRALIGAHIVSGKALRLADLDGEGQELRSEGEAVLRLRPASRASALVTAAAAGPWEGRTARIVEPDIVAANGVIHAIDGLMLR
ncbi:fasciclin domain-containing protein [Crenalkalicoccus roseus]|uniref:fasciclin domain-containing protein n=1 Tax=Crenalkalicoccus roseus TaxID=1485588 RepID=UPI0013053BF9|nr:fasciclin domain-containing protein [Crenalkalicoccus roseus]